MKALAAGPTGESEEEWARREWLENSVPEEEIESDEERRRRLIIGGQPYTEAEYKKQEPLFLSRIFRFDCLNTTKRADDSPIWVPTGLERGRVQGCDAQGAAWALICTGSMIDPTHVLTAAHCIDGLEQGRR